MGTPLTSAPEILYWNFELDDYSYTSKADLWSIGVVFYQILFGRYPFFGTYAGEIYQSIKKNASNLRFDLQKVSPEAQDLLRKIFVIDFKKRIEWDDFFTHPFFRDD